MNLTGTIILWIVYFVSLYFSVFLVLIFFDKKKDFKNEEEGEKHKMEQKLSSFPIVSIIIPAYNEEKNIIKTLESVTNINYPKERLDIIVINDGSKDNTENKIKDYIYKNNLNNFKLLSHKNIGKAASLNKALKITKGEYFACLDADSFVEPDTLKKMLSFYHQQNDPKLVIVTPAMKVYKPKNILQKIQWIEYLVMILIGRITSHLDSLYVAPGPFSLYRTDIIKEVGGFDEKTLTEDQEIAYRIQNQHYRIKQCFDAYVYTVSPDKIVPFYKQRRRWYLGSITCAYQYRHLVGNKDYGDFGVMQMVKNVIGYFVVLTGIGFASYYLIWPFLLKIKRGFVISFDLLPFFKDLNFIFNPLFIDIPKIIIVTALFSTSIFFFYQAHKNAKEKIKSFGYLPIIPYFAFYYMLKGGILMLSLYEFAKGKKIKW